MSNNTPDYDNLYFACNKTQANDLACNKISLTSQWRKGELPDGWYWVKRVTWSECINMLYNWSDTFLDGDVPVDNDEIIEVLAEVPDYIEWRNMVNCACEEHEANKRLIEEKDKLKELLTEIRGKIKTVYDMDLNQFITSAAFTDDFVKKIDEVLK